MGKVRHTVNPNTLIERSLFHLIKLLGLWPTRKEQCTGSSYCTGKLSLTFTTDCD